jgi:hypothetical protein
VRERLVSQRTAIINQIRAFLLERGIAVRHGLRFLRAELPGILAKCSAACSRFLHGPSVPCHILQHMRGYGAPPYPRPRPSAAGFRSDARVKCPNTASISPGLSRTTSWCRRISSACTSI